MKTKYSLLEEHALELVWTPKEETSAVIQLQEKDATVETVLSEILPEDVFHQTNAAARSQTEVDCSVLANR